MQQTIGLYRTSSGWIAKHSDPEIKRLFGTDTLLAAFTHRADEQYVKREIEKLNPGVRVGFLPFMSTI